MKKMKFVISLLLGFLILTSCNGENSENYISEPTTEEISETEKTIRTVDISEGIEDGNGFFYEYDFDFDGEAEQIKIVVAGGENEWDQYMDVSVGNSVTTLKVMDAWLAKVYACDIDTTDGVLDLAVITSEVSGDVGLRIFNYGKEGLSCYEFNLYNSWDEEYNVDICNWLGYPVSYYFNVNDDNTITVEEQTTSYGMWSVYKTYALNYAGQFELFVEEKYDVLPDFMEKNTFYTEEYMTDEEKEMWKKGYIVAQEVYDNGEITVEKGECFKVLYDDCDNKIFIEKENGESGWMELDLSMYHINEAFFYLAG